MRRHQPWLVVVLLGAIVGTVFAAVSTYDFVQHLDRQVHNLHCSFIPGAIHPGESGCQVAMMSPYSSVLRGQVWGGVPISLPAMSVFAFLMLLSADLLLTRRKDDPRATGFLALATALPAATSLVMLVMLRHAAALRPTAACIAGGLAVAAITSCALSLIHDLDATIMILIWNLGTAAMIAGLAAAFGQRALSGIAGRFM